MTCYLVISLDCNHVALVTPERTHADRQAYLADTAGYPTSILTSPDTPPADASPSDCDVCWRRMDATLHLMQRDRLAGWALDTRHDPFEAIATFDRIMRRAPRMRKQRAADIVINGMRNHQPGEHAFRWDTEALDPADPSLRRTS